MVSQNSNAEIEKLAVELSDRLVQRGLISPTLREAAADYLRMELLRSLRRVAKVTSRNAEFALMAHRMM